MPMPSTEPTPTRRIGTFTISRHFIDQWPVLVSLLPAHFVLHAESRFDRDCIVYVALCAGFDEVPVGQRPPTYVPTFQRVDHITVFAGWRRVPEDEVPWQVTMDDLSDMLEQDRRENTPREEG